MKMDRGRLTNASQSLAVTLGLVVAVSSANAGMDRVGAEYSVLGPQVGDQFFPDVSLGSDGGYLVWQDNNSDEEGLGIRAARINGNLNAVMGAFQVNERGTGDQQRPVVTSLIDGGAAFAWEDGDDVFIRFVGSDGSFVGSEQKVNSYVENVQRDAAIATLNNGNVAVVWSSLDQDGDMQGVYGQIFDSSGQKLGAEFFVNQSVFFNQRTPSVSALENGHFVVAWISEKFAGARDRTDENGRIPGANAGGESYEVTAFGRIFDETGLAVSDEIALGDSANIDANPMIVGVDGGFMAFYSGRENVEKITALSEMESGWDIYGQRFDQVGNPLGEIIVVNENTYGDQLVPTAASLGNGVLVTWTSLGQDGDEEGVFARLIGIDNGTSTGEFQVNSISENRQLLPAVGANQEGMALIVWGSYKGGIDSFDLHSQKFSLEGQLPVLEAPFVYSAGYWSMGVSWPSLDGVEIDSYELYIDGSDTPIVTSGNLHTLTGLNAGTEHSIELAYVLPDGTRSPRSAPGVASTWGRDTNGDQLPDDWQQRYFGSSVVEWPASDDDSDGDGVINIDELLGGTDPTDPDSLLGTEVISTASGLVLKWNTQPGAVYQVQVTTDISSWYDAGTPRLSVGEFDSISIVNDQGIAVYRVVRLR